MTEELKPVRTEGFARECREIADALKVEYGQRRNRNGMPYLDFERHPYVGRAGALLRQATAIVAELEALRATPAPAQPGPLHVANERGEGVAEAGMAAPESKKSKATAEMIQAGAAVIDRETRGLFKQVSDGTTTDTARMVWHAMAVAARKQALQEAHDAMFDIKGDKVTRFDAQTAIRNLMDAPKGKT